MNGIMDREHTLVIDISTAQGSVEALQILDEAVSGLTRMPGEKLQIGLDCGGLLLTQRVMEKVVAVLERHNIVLHTIYARLPQTQQTALGMDLFVKEAPPKPDNKNPWRAYLKEQTQGSTELQETLEEETRPIDVNVRDTELPFQPPRRSAQSTKPGAHISEPNAHFDDLLHRKRRQKASRLDGIKQLAKDFLNRTQSPKDAYNAIAANDPDPFEAALGFQPSDSSSTTNPVPELQQAIQAQHLPESSEALTEAPSSSVVAHKASSPSVSLSERAQQQPVLTPSHQQPASEEKHNALQPLPLPEMHFNDQIPTRLVEGPIRSGQAAYSDGHLVIIGDVHGGSELVAKGSIVVWGELRGIAQAGAEGDLTSTIRALSIHAIQLRIGSIFARRPDRVDYHKQPTLQELSNLVMPEVARIVDGEIKIYKDASGR